VACACNPCYICDRDQEDHDSRAAWANSSARTYFKKTLHKKGTGGVAQGVGPEFKAQYHKKEKKKRKLLLALMHNFVIILTIIFFPLAKQHPKFHYL
jgi:hypothetical protein